ncbi:MAG: peptidoglycan DD-metalloendopeptidase family protein [Leucobacter sp.]|nr:peptidoglycan DD-metalloendopeptidase family protein [Leucobacter sp.]
MPHSPQEPTAFPSRRSIREARLRAESRESAAPTADSSAAAAKTAPVEQPAATAVPTPTEAAASPASPAAESQQEAPGTKSGTAQQTDPLRGLLLTPLPEFKVSTGTQEAQPDAAEHSTQPRPKRRTARRLAAATFSVACVGTLALTTALPAFSSAFGDAAAVAARTDQQLQSSDVVAAQDALDAIGSVELGVDPGSYKQITPEAGLIDPALLENTEIRNAFDREFPLTDGFAYRTAPVEQFHDAQDIAAPGGTPVLAIGSGEVIEAGYASDGCGFSAKLQHKVNDETLTSRYCHMQVDSHDLKVGDKVKIGDPIGRVGNTGMSFGDHLHLALRRSGVPIDPLPYIQEQIEKAAKRAAATK